MWHVPPWRGDFFLLSGANLKCGLYALNNTVSHKKFTNCPFKEGSMSSKEIWWSPSVSMDTPCHKIKSRLGGGGGSRRGVGYIFHLSLQPWFHAYMSTCMHAFVHVLTFMYVTCMCAFIHDSLKGGRAIKSVVGGRGGGTPRSDTLGAYHGMSFMEFEQLCEFEAMIITV